MPAGKSKEEDTVDKVYWSKEEEVMLIHEHGKARSNGVFARPGTWEVCCRDVMYIKHLLPLPL